MWGSLRSHLGHVSVASGAWGVAVKSVVYYLNVFACRGAMLSGCARECAHTREEFASDVAKIYNIVNYRPRHPQTLFRKLY